MKKEEFLEEVNKRRPIFTIMTDDGKKHSIYSDGRIDQYISDAFKEKNGRSVIQVNDFATFKDFVAGNIIKGIEK